MDWLDMLRHAPFVCMVKGRPQINTTRIWEAVIIAAVSGVVAGLLASQITIAKIEERVSLNTKRLDRIEQDVYSPRGGR